ncbi:MAG: hypothetical protein V7763_04080 [Sulfitobacter sp.]|jgi:hypothetical protein|uniref:hypothetical protein n=1 Tax=Sulfitobacter sp. TaxID=1903071 RepID=UPI00269D371C|tara:strand:- start:12498 stop:12674 length:177 start_codon:yes stop_codon:yes gene_type:complete
MKTSKLIFVLVLGALASGCAAAEFNNDNGLVDRSSFSMVAFGFDDAPNLSPVGANLAR